MNKYLIYTTLFCLSTVANAQDISTETNNNMLKKSTPICLIQGVPNNYQFTEIKRLKIGKGTYGSVTDLYPKILEKTHRLKADAVIHYNASQRFGFWPWRLIRPVMTGTAIKWLSKPPSCASLGGTEIQ